MTTRLERVKQFQEILVARATGVETSDQEYIRLRLELLKDSKIRELLPQFVKTCDELPKFWGFIKKEFSTYQERRKFIWEQFNSLIASLEESIITTQPADDDISAILINFDTEHIHIAWQKALDRREDDPEAAITMARTLVESVCKHILDAAGVSYTDKDNLPNLYLKTAEQLNMAPEQHQEEIFKKIFDGCQTVILGLGTLRNKLSNAHGKGKKAVITLCTTCCTRCKLGGFDGCISGRCLGGASVESDLTLRALPKRIGIAGYVRLLTSS